ncbi:hypothetical protein VPH35_132226 [Triticum aestivum]
MMTSRQFKLELFCDLHIGCAASSRTYKVVCLKRQYCKVLTLEDGTKWRQVQSPREVVITHGYDNNFVVAINGVKELYVLRFDLESEEWRASIRGPLRSGEKLQEKTTTRYITKLNDALCMVQQSSTNIWLIWLLADPTKSTWVKEYTIPMASSVVRVMPLTVMCDTQKLLFYLCDRSSATSTLQVYDPLIQKCTERLKFESNLVGAVLCDLHMEHFVSTKILPMAPQSVLSPLVEKGPIVLVRKGHLFRFLNQN